MELERSTLPALALFAATNATQQRSEILMDHDAILTGERVCPACRCRVVDRRCGLENQRGYAGCNSVEVNSLGGELLANAQRSTETSPIVAGALGLVHCANCMTRSWDGACVVW